MPDFVHDAVAGKGQTDHLIVGEEQLWLRVAIQKAYLEGRELVRVSEHPPASCGAWIDQGRDDDAIRLFFIGFLNGTAVADGLRTSFAKDIADLVRREIIVGELPLILGDCRAFQRERNYQNPGSDAKVLPLFFSVWDFIDVRPVLIAVETSAYSPSEMLLWPSAKSATPS